MSTCASEWIDDIGAVAELYEREIVPTVFAPFARDLVESAALRPGDRMLDIGTGTGIVARIAAERIDATGRIVGVDKSSTMLAVAQRVAGTLPIEWVESDVAELTVFEPGSFDVVLGQQVLQFLPDLPRACAAIRRCLAPGGRALMSVWTAFEEAPAHLAMAEAIGRHVSPEAALPLPAIIFGLSRAEQLAAPLRAAGFSDVTVERHSKMLPFTSVEQFARPLVTGLLTDVSREIVERVIEDVAQALASRRDAGGGITLPLSTHIAIARGG